MFYKVGSFLISLVISGSAIAVEVPNVFVSGEKASAQSVNENFTALSGAINANSSAVTEIQNTQAVTDIYVSSSDYSSSSAWTSEILTATCPEGTTLVGGSVSCITENQDFSTTNLGIPASTIMVGSSVIGYCAAEASTSYSYLYGPPVSVYAACLYFVPPDSDSSMGRSVKRAGQGTPEQPALDETERLRAISLLRQQRIDAQLK